MMSWTIRTRLMVGVALSVLVLVAINGVYNYQQARSALVESVSDTVQRSGTSTRRFVSTWLASKAQVVESAAQAIANAPDPIPVLTQGNNAGSFLYMYLGTRAGEMIMFPAESLPDDFDPAPGPGSFKLRRNSNALLPPLY